MEASQAAGIDRRNFLKLAATLPLLGTLGAIVSPLLRFLKPNIEPFRVYVPTAQDVPKGEQIPGRVLSGPAPRPPRTFLFEIVGQNIVVTAVERGGIA